MPYSHTRKVVIFVYTFEYMENYMVQISKIVADLSSIGDEIKDCGLIMTSLCSSPDDYGNLVSS